MISLAASDRVLTFSRKLIADTVRGSMGGLLAGLLIHIQYLVMNVVTNENESLCFNTWSEALWLTTSPYDLGSVSWKLTCLYLPAPISMASWPSRVLRELIWNLLSGVKIPLREPEAAHGV